MSEVQANAKTGATLTAATVLAGSRPAVPSWFRRLLSDTGQNLWLKIPGITAVITLFFYLYFLLLHHPQFPVTVMPLTIVDEWITFQPVALFLYVTLWVYVTLPPTFIGDLRELLFYGVVVGVICLIGLGIFFFWPNAVPVPVVDWNAHPGFSFLKGVDASGNACPSLHVAFSVFSAIALARQLRRLGAPAWTRVGNWLWCIAIVYSTLATKQHVAIDAVAGIALGIFGGALLRLRKNPAGPAKV